MAIELELKYHCPAPVQAQIAAGLGDAYRSIPMETTYYDTPGGDLSRRHWTLRRRMEDGISVCTLKMPAGPAREEYEVEAEALADALPTLSRLSGAELPRELVAVCGARFTRRAWLVREAGFTAELALDLGELTAGDKTAPICELEVELKDGLADMMTLWAMALAQRYGLSTEPKSKFARAKALAEGGSHG